MRTVRAVTHHWPRRAPPGTPHVDRDGYERAPNRREMRARRAGEAASSHQGPKLAVEGLCRPAWSTDAHTLVARQRVERVPDSHAVRGDRTWVPAGTGQPVRVSIRHRRCAVRRVGSRLLEPAHHRARDRPDPWPRPLRVRDGRELRASVLRRVRAGGLSHQCRCSRGSNPGRARHLRARPGAWRACARAGRDCTAARSPTRPHWRPCRNG